MTFDSNDPRLTAYVLDDPSLSADDRAEIAKQLESDPKAKRFAEELRASATLLGDCLSKEPMPIAADAPSMEAAVRSHFAKPKGKSWTTFLAPIIAIAACVALVSFVSWPHMLTTNAVARMTLKNTADRIENETDSNVQSAVTLEFRGSAEGQSNTSQIPGQPQGQEESKTPQPDSQHFFFGADPRPAKDVSDSYAFSVEAKRSGGVSGKAAPADVADNTSRGLFVMASSPELAKRPMPTNQPTRSDGGKSVPSMANGGISLNAEWNARRNLGEALDARGGRELKTKLDSGLSREESEKLIGRLDAINIDASKPIAEREADVKQIVDELRAKAATYAMPAPGLVKVEVSNTEAYPVLQENEFISAQGLNALSTFSIDVDTASYANIRRFLNQNALPPAGAVRIEEMINYFPYDYPPPVGDVPFAVHLETAECPWNPQHRLARIALKGKEIDTSKRPMSNLVFLLDVSGSMNEPNKLPLVKESLKLLVDQLGENDRVAIAVYAGSSGLVLDSTRGDQKASILYAIDNLQPSGSTNGAAGIKCAYDAAVKGFIKGGTNRVILMTDGDFNVGVTSDDELVKLITEKAKTGVFLSVLGFGMGNYKDAKMMQLADKGNGNYAYIDSKKEAQKVLVEQMSGTLVTIAKDVKIQVEFNPTKVSAYRLVGYEKRMLKAEDFKDDKKDAGEIGAGHTVTALYEIVPGGMSSPAGKVDDLVFQKPASNGEQPKQDEEHSRMSFIVKLRYKQPDGAVSTELRFPGMDEGKKYTQASADFQFAAAVASFGQLLRESQFKGNATLAAVCELAEASKGKDPSGYRAEFLGLVKKAMALKK